MNLDEILTGEILYEAWRDIFGGECWNALTTEDARPWEDMARTLAENVADRFEDADVEGWL